MKKKIIAAGIVLGLIGAAAAYHYLHNSHDTELRLFGNVAIRDVELGFRVFGRIEEMRFEEGQRVKKGDILAALDRRPFEEALRLAEARKASAEFEMKKLEHGYRRQEVMTARAKVEEAEAVYKNTQRLYERRMPLLKSGAISEQGFDNTRTTRDEALARLESAKQDLNRMTEGYRVEDVDRAKSEYQAAVAQLGQAKIDLEDTTLIAPDKGTLLTRVREPGAVVAKGAIVYTLALDHPIWVRTYVSEPQLGCVFPGQKALVYTDSRPDKPYVGHVGFISPQAEFTPKNVETTELRTELVYRLRVVVKGPERGLRQGMPVTVELSEGESDG
jgi:membrane fusion protein YbhG